MNKVYPLPELSICFSVKNRSKVTLDNGRTLYLFPNCLDALLEALNPDDRIEILICDWHSTDWPLGQWIPEKIKGWPYRIISADGIFHRGKGRNIAAAEARGELLFFLDCDMLPNRTVIDRAFHFAREQKVYFPHSFYFIDPEHSRGFWCRGKGNCALSKALFFQSGQWPCPPTFNRGREEDQQFFKNIQRMGLDFIREDVSGFFHQYHPGRSVDAVQRPNQRHYILKYPSETGS